MPHDAAVVGIDYSEDGVRLLTASLDGHVRLWNPSNATELCQPMPHDSQVLSVWFDDTDQQALSLTLGGQATAWNLATSPAYDVPSLFDGEVGAMSRDLQRSVVYRNNRIYLQKADGTLSEHQPTNRPESIRFCRFRADRQHHRADSPFRGARGDALQA